MGTRNASPGLTLSWKTTASKQPARSPHSRRFPRLVDGLVDAKERTAVANGPALGRANATPLWEFINVAAQFNMDSLLFDAFNGEWRRHSEDRS